MKTCTTCGAEWPDDTKFCPNDGTTLRSASGTADLIGSVVADRYHIQKKLGEGGMGAVYLGEHVKMGRKSAIKVMTQAMANDPEAIARFNREAANAARISHPNVCAIYDFGETSDGLIYLAMEFIEGEALSSVLRAQGTLPLPRAAAILHQTADALQAAHDLGIVHRDLKPDNVMLAKGRGGADLVKVVDFGIAKAMTGEEGQKVTKTGLVVGTPEYMSPEQLSGDVLDGRSDIYSLALVFYRMITGTLPFQADTAQETMIKRLTDDPMPLADAQPEAAYPPKLQEVISRALARMPGDRYASAAEFAKDVDAAVKGAPGARPAPVDTEGATQLLDAGAVTEQLVPTRVAGESAATPTPTTPAPAAAPPHAPGKGKRKPIVAIAASVVVLAAGGGTAWMMFGGHANQQQLSSLDSANTVGAVMDDTAQNQSGNDHPSTPVTTQGGGPGNTSQQAGGNPPSDGGGQQTANQPVTNPGGGGRPVDTPVDSAGIDRELQSLLSAVDSASRRATVRQRAEDYYNNPRVPTNLRAFAASVVGQAYFAEDRTDDVCRWYRLAAGLDPNNQAYAETLRLLSCQ